MTEKHPGGRPPWAPSAHDRQQVELMIACGIPEDLIAAVLGTSAPTLRKHCAAEIASAGTKVKARVGQFIVASILGLGGGVKDDRARATLAMFFAKTRMGWRETSAVELSGPDGKPIETRGGASAELISELDRIAKRLAGGKAGEAPEIPS